MKRKNQIHKKRFDAVDVVVVVLLTLWMLLVIVPFVNAISISFATQKEYVDNPLMLFPSQPTLQSYKVLLNDYRIWVGFRTSFFIGSGGRSGKHAFDYNVGIWHQPRKLSRKKDYYRRNSLHNAF